MRRKAERRAVRRREASGPFGFVNWGRLPLYRFVPLVKVLLERLRRAIRALAGSALHLDNAQFAISGS